MPRSLSFSDRLVTHLDNALKTLTPGAVQAREPNPARHREAPALEPDQSRHIAGLMRINHTGEVCAQGLYQGQALTAKLARVRTSMEEAADEELDHLAWCEQRLGELNSRTSYLNPVFYGLSYAMGAAAGIAGDAWSLGFVAATEDQVSAHLRDHLHQIDQQDPRSTVILERMLEDEERHAEHALAAGGRDFPPQVKQIMTGISKVMTRTVYRI
ncbi:2-polyprenyl-3-methyl-6-methoxy-1,4-benzoquinone monooxygenase [Saccharospirillum impatiens]|uniref:2-polyprenyl-3-methyl-6-methoxy-1,4-benzoquinone monooxygenase n=1 Tax=Saccharospirillum impatiens TaxID=169438 RepID=UPI000425D34B|nr:2-polyprenyl-3-methyl-6-methoxy-1,4-benzoquinone monooxygenase [Saccharospirillum impatiens]